MADAVFPIVKLGTVASMESGGTPASGTSRYYHGGIPWVSISDMTAGGKYIGETQKTLSDEGLAIGAAKLYDAEVVLYAMYASLGECSLAVGRVSSSQAILGITTTPRLDREFLYYYLQSIKPRVKTMGQQGTQSNLNAGMVRNFGVPVPDVSEQRRIASVLAEIDELVTCSERLIAKKNALKQGMMQQLLMGYTRLPGFTAAWKSRRLGDHVVFLRNVALSRAQLDSTSPLRYLHYGDIHTRQSCTLDMSTEPMPRATATLAGRASRLQGGDLVFADASEDAAGVGKSVEIVGVPTEGAVPGLHTITARFDAQVLADGFKAYLQFNPVFRKALLRLASGTKVLATTRSFIAGIELELPEVDEQRAIAKALTDAETEICTLERRLENTRAIKQGMMQELLTGRTRLGVERDAA